MVNLSNLRVILVVEQDVDSYVLGAALFLFETDERKERADALLKQLRKNSSILTYEQFYRNFEDMLDNNDIPFTLLNPKRIEQRAS